MANAPAVDDTVIDDPTDNQPATPPTLDQVHAISQAQVNEEDEENADDETGSEGKQPSGAGDDASNTDDDSDDTGSDDATGDDDSSGDADASDDTAATDGSDTDDSADDDIEDGDTATGTTPEPAAELDTDITKSATGKVAIKDAEGKTFYFNNLDEVPEDFEPESYKALMVGTKALLQKEESDAKDAADAEADAAKEEHRKDTEALQKQWDGEADRLVKAGQLPKDPKKLEAAKEEVYDYIEKELTNGNIITSFGQGFKSLQFDKAQEEKAKKQKELDDAKSKRGGVVQPGSGGSDGTPPSRGGKVIEAPPSGAGLDAVHHQVISTL